MTERLSERGAAERLEAIERQFDLYSLKLHGWVAWRAIRGPVAFLLNGYSVAQQSAASRQLSLPSIAAEVARYAWALLKRQRRTLLIRTLSSATGEPQGSKLRDIYFDSLLENGLDAHKVHQQNTARSIRRAQMLFPYETSHSGIAALARVLAAVWISAETSRVARRLCDALIALDRESVTYAWVVRRLGSIRWQAWLYGMLLKAVRPRAVLVADAGEYALNIACKRLGVTFVEIQHGVFTENHPDAVPAWALHHATAAELILPDVLGVFGAYWARRLHDTALGRQRLVPVGSDVLDRWRERRNERKRRADLSVTILVTTQGQERARLIDWLETVIAQAPLERQWRIVVKLHPIYDGDPALYSSLMAHSGVEIVGQGSSRSVYELMVEADAHASISSASHFDAIGLNVPTVVIPLPGSELVMDMVDGTRVFRGDDPRQVWDCALNPRPPETGDDDLYAAGFVDRVRNIVS
jgi:hypothetical protein